MFPRSIMARTLDSLEDEFLGFDSILAHLSNKYKLRGMNVCLAVDGSRVTEKATKTMLSIMSSMERGVRPVKSKLQVLHVFDPSKPTPRHLTPTRVIEGAKSNIESSLGPGADVLYTSSETDKSQNPGGAVEADGNASDSDVGGTCDTLMRLSDKFGTDLLVLGAAGVNEKGINILGSVSNGCLRSSDSSILLIKSTAVNDTQQQQNVYVLATDGSEASRLAAVFLSFLVADDDVIRIVHVTEHASDTVHEEELLRPYSELFGKCGDVSFEVVESMYSVTVATTIVDYAMRKQADYIVLGISGYGKQKLGSVSSKVCRESRCSTIVVKDPREVSTAAKKT